MLVWQAMGQGTEEEEGTMRWASSGMSGLPSFAPIPASSTPLTGLSLARACARSLSLTHTHALSTALTGLSTICLGIHKDTHTHAERARAREREREKPCVLGFTMTRTRTRARHTDSSVDAQGIIQRGDGRRRCSS